MGQIGLSYFTVKGHKLSLQTYFWFFAHSLCTPDVVDELLNYFSTERESEVKVSSFPL